MFQLTRKRSRTPQMEIRLLKNEDSLVVIGEKDTPPEVFTSVLKMGQLMIEKEATVKSL